MPELGEVEIMRRRVAGAALGQILEPGLAGDPRLLSALEGLDGERLSAVDRRGKNLLLQLGPVRLHLHLRMTGELRVGRALVGARHLRLRLRFGSCELGLEDPRRFATLERLPPGQTEPAGLGPEPWPEARSGAWWAARYAGVRGPLKVALLDQGRVAGLGNIAASELCWRVRLSPSTPASALLATDWQALAGAVPAFLDEVIAAEDPDVEATFRYVNAGGKNPFAVYGRAGQPCPRCSGAISRLMQAGRSTFWCQGCQRLPPAG